MSRIRTVVFIDNVHMGLGHDGLTLVAKKFSVDPARLGDGEIVMFLNRGRDKLKIMGKQGKVIGYLKMPNKSRIMLDAIQYIPQCFGADGSLNYDAAIKKALEERLAKQRSKPTSPLQAFRAARQAGV